MAESSVSDLDGERVETGGSLTDRAYRQLEEMIVTLRLAPGEVLSEATLSKQLAIGRTPIREALQRLAREGLVVILPRRGILVAEINVRSQLELLKVRRELERLMSRLCALRSTKAEKRAFSELADAMEAAGEADDDVAFMRQDRQLNGMISQCCRNEYALKAMGLTACRGASGTSTTGRSWTCRSARACTPARPGRSPRATRRRPPRPPTASSTTWRPSRGPPSTPRSRRRPAAAAEGSA
jgi:DNA-binding GntR family transcriptional regulator